MSAPDPIPMNNGSSDSTLPGDPEKTNNTINTEEPPLKRMKVASPQIPHYNSHNIYSRPPAVPSTVPIPSLPAIIAPVSPLSAFSDSENNQSMEYGQSVAPLAAPSEKWPLCAYCGKDGDLSRCSSCRQSYYCNRECQVAHWEVHCIICQPGPPQPPPVVVGANIQPPQPRPYNNMYPPSVQTQCIPITPRNTQNRQNRRTNYTNYSNNDNRNKEQYYCEECDRYFKNGQALGGHRSRVHSSRRNGGGDPNQSANGVRKRRRPRPSRARHNPTGNGQYVCPHCGREFATGNALGGHISGAHTKKSKRAARNYDPGTYGRPRHPNM